MALWKRKVPNSSEPGASDGIEVGGRDVPVGTPHFDPKKALAVHGIQLTAKADLTDDDLARDGGLKNPEQDEVFRKKRTVLGKDDGPGPAEVGSVASSEMKDVKPKVNYTEGKVGIMSDEMAVRKDTPVQVDDDPPAGPSLVGPGFQWHRSIPQQKPLTAGSRPPKIPFAGAPVSDPNSGYVRKDMMSDVQPTTNWASGRPRWMEYPGFAGPTPQYASQKPGKNGNNDTLFSHNINKNPPKVNPVDPDSYYFW